MILSGRLLRCYLRIRIIRRSVFLWIHRFVARVYGVYIDDEGGRWIIK
jgi:hypothetical protein